MKSRARILVVDDERSMQEFLEIFLRREGYDVETVGSVDAALALAEGGEFELVVTDMQMPEKTGLDLLRALHAVSPETLVVMITAFASTDGAIAAMKEGAYDYITKPFKVDEIRVVIEKALEKRLLARDNELLRSQLRTRVRSRSIIGNGPPIQRVFELVSQVATTKTNVLISGESGTGKELVARAIHEQSNRHDAPFIAVNCGAIPENLLESELFGHVKGAFTGAIANKEGLFEAADGGTLFLDEVGELPPSLQVKLLRVIQDKVLRRVGGTSDRSIDIRILCATNRRLEEEVAAGRFREDLYYRLNVIQIPLPALRERPEDIPMLVAHFVEKYSEELGKPIESLSDATMEKLQGYRYPGNVRELENILERAVALCRSTSIDVDVLPPNLLERPSVAPTSRIGADGVDLEALVNDYERGLLREALGHSDGVKKRAAKLLGISFRSLRYRLEKLGLADSNEG